MSDTEKNEKKKQPPSSRVGRQPVVIPAGVKVSIVDGCVSAEGPRGKLAWGLPKRIRAEIEGNELRVVAASHDFKTKALHGLSRKLVFNMVHGVSEGFQKKLVVDGVGFRAQVSGSKLTLTLGFSHPYSFDIPKEVAVKQPDPKSPNLLVVEGISKEIVGNVAAAIRGIRPPEPYKGTGIRYEGEVIKRKAGKAAIGSTGGKK